MGSYPRCAPRSGRCGWGQGVVCVRVCLAEASVGLIGGCVRSCRLGGARRHPPPRAHGGSCRWLGLLCRAKRLLTRRLGVCSQVAIRKAEWSVGALARWLLCAVMSAWRCSPPPPRPGLMGAHAGGWACFPPPVHRRAPVSVCPCMCARVCLAEASVGLIGGCGRRPPEWSIAVRPGASCMCPCLCARDTVCP